MRRRSWGPPPVPTAPKRRVRAASPLAVSSIGVDEPPLALVATGSMVEAASLMGAAATSPSLAQQVAAAAGMRVVERFEVTT